MCLFYLLVCAEPMAAGLPTNQITASSSTPENPAKLVKTDKDGWSPLPDDNNRWVQFEFAEPTEVNGIAVMTTATTVSVKTSEDGALWETILVRKQVYFHVEKNLENFFVDYRKPIGIRVDRSSAGRTSCH